MLPAQTEAEIDHRLAATLQPGSPNVIRAAELREWAVEYLTDYDEELDRFPELVGESHWNLWMKDGSLQNAMFAVLVFQSSGVKILCGTGKASSVKGFANSGFPDDVEQLPEELARLFAMPEGNLYLDRTDAEAWLGRGW
jgi:hypothetical protein